MQSYAVQYLNTFYKILDDMEREMKEAELSNSISADFINQMIPHHQAAIKMSENILKYSGDKQIRAIAENIISEQTKSIADMRASYPQCREKVNSNSDIASYMERFKAVTDIMFEQMRNSPASSNVNYDFLVEMIPHHRGAVRMSANLLRFNICRQLIPIADAIIVSQLEGIREMEKLLKEYSK